MRKAMVLPDGGDFHGAGVAHDCDNMKRAARNGCATKTEGFLIQLWVTEERRKPRT
jgi:hypothetical protein